MIDYGFANSELISKRSSERQRNASGAALAAGGGTAATAGLIAGGVPGVKGKFNWDDLDAMLHGTKNLPDNTYLHPSKKKVSLKTRIGATSRTVKGGVLGWRINAHEEGRRGFGQEKIDLAPTKHLNHADSFEYGRSSGKIPHETKIIPHMKAGKLASNAILAGGAGAAAYGAYRMKTAKPSNKVHKSRKSNDRYGGAALGVGTTGIVGSIAGDKVASGQAKRWEADEAKNLNRAHKLVPRLKPEIHDDTVTLKAEEIFRGKSKATSEAAGAFRGKASQSRHFAGVYRNTSKGFRYAKYPSLVAAGVGTGLLLSGRHAKKDRRAS